MKTSRLIFVPIFICLLFQFTIFSQGEGNNWNFGCSTGITFNTTPPSIISSSLQTREGVASISDANGNLLFYTDGQKIFNSSGIITATGLLGHPSSTSSAIIIPKGDTNTSNYWIFTVDAESGRNGINYYEYNTETESLVGGASNLISSTTSIKHTEKITAVKKCNAEGYWVCTITRAGDFKIYDVSSTIFLANTFSTNTRLDRRNSISYLKFSPNGEYLAHAIPFDPSGNLTFRGVVNLYSFDKITGTINNPTTPEILDFTDDGTGNAIGQPYGIEFSNNSKYLYVSIIVSANRPIEGGSLYQFDLTSIPINSTRIRIGLASLPNINYGALQMGPDGKIYLAMEDGVDQTSSCACFGTHSFLGIIENPDGIGGEPSFIQDGLSLQTISIFSDNCSPSNSSNGGVKVGLPTFISGIYQSNLNSNLKINLSCNEGSVHSKPNASCNSPFSFLWSTGFSETNVDSSQLIGLGSGNYSLTITDNSGSVVIDSFIIPTPLPIDIALPPEIEVQIGGSAELNPTLTNISTDNIQSIQWTPEIDLSCSDCLNPILMPASGRAYTVKITTVDGCNASAMVQIKLVEEEEGKNEDTLIYMPSAFSPLLQDGINDIFLINAKKGSVSNIILFRILDRWGNLVFEKSNFQPNDSAYGWDGTFHGKKMNNAVFAYYALIEFTDGRTKSFKGEIVLVK